MSCQSCRTHHYRCDNKLPKCGRCSRVGRTCVRNSSLRIRQSSVGKSFLGDETWVRVPPKVDFVDETDEIGQDYEQENTSENLEPFSSDLRSPSPIIHPSLSGSIATPSSLFTLSEAIIEPDITQTNAFTDERNNIFPIDKHRNHEITRRLTTISPSNSHLSIQSSQSYVGNAEEARLLRNYIDNLSRFSDFCDPNRHFARQVPQRARKNRTLATAIFALSARHLSRIQENFDPFAADRYYQECLQTLIPALTDKEAVIDDSLLAATVILRFLEEMDVPLSGSDMRGHLFGTQAIIRAQKITSQPSTLWLAASRAAFHQEVYNSISCQRAVQTSLIPADTSSSSCDEDDSYWTWRAIIHFGEVLKFTFGTDSHSLALHRHLVAENDKWPVSRPEEYDYYFSCERQATSEFDAFPDIRFHMDWHAMGPQYNALSRILLILGDPSLPRMGLHHAQATKKIDEEAVSLLRKIVGISLSNEQAPPSSIVSCMAISLCGDKFMDHEEQKQILRFLIRTETLYGWPTATIQEQLRRVWS